MKKVIDRVIEISVEGGRSAWGRQNAIRKLKANKEKAVQLLFERLSDEKDDEVQCAIIEILGEMKPSAAWDKLQLLFTASEELDYEVRICLLDALFEIDQARAMEVIKDVLEEDYTLVRERAIQLLKGARRKVASRSLLRKVFNDKEEELGVRLVAAEALGELGDPIGHELALDVLEDIDDEYNREICDGACEVLAAIGLKDEKTFLALKKYEQDSAASRALKKLGYESQNFRQRVSKLNRKC